MYLRCQMCSWTFWCCVGVHSGLRAHITERMSPSPLPEHPRGSRQNSNASLFTQKKKNGFVLLLLFCGELPLPPPPPPPPLLCEHPSTSFAMRSLLLCYSFRSSTPQTADCTVQHNCCAQWMEILHFTSESLYFLFRDVFCKNLFQSCTVTTRVFKKQIPPMLLCMRTSWPARRCPGIRAPRRSLSLRCPGSAQLSHFPINQSRGEHTILWRKFALRWTCIITAFAFGKKWFGLLNINVFITDKRKRARKKRANVKLQHNIAASLPPWLNPTLSLRDRLTHGWTRFTMENFFLNFCWFPKKKSHSGMVKRKIRADYRCPRWTGSS